MTITTTHSINMTGAWQKLVEHRASGEPDLRTLFSKHPDRANRFSLGRENILIDFSKQKITDETLSLLYALAEQQNIEVAIDGLMSGRKINSTEQRPALHTALRSDMHSFTVDGKNIMDEIRDGKQRISDVVMALHSGSICGYTGKKIRTVINIGIGGSDLGPRLAVHALHDFRQGNIDVRFAANIDYQDLQSCLEGADPETTLFIIASKSFTTLETLNNALSARHWLTEHGCNDHAKHFIAVTANREAAVGFGIDPDHILEFREWVGGRYSLWSTIGLPIAIATGVDNFNELLSGARSMDGHFADSPFPENIPVTLALIDIWNNNFLDAGTLAVIPYDHALELLPSYLSQLMMESNGKNVTRDGDAVDYNTGMIVWGGAGTNSQHAFFQLLHQGTRNIPVEFLVGMNANSGRVDHQARLVANCFAQGEALMAGRKNREDEPWRNFPGNRPSTTIVYDRMTPFVLGQLLAMYEHRTYVQACIWNINAFDQWGVELGKQLAGKIIDEFESGKVGDDHDASSRRLIELYLNKGKL